jgi:xanthine dehydrogenase accessory factor
MTDNRPDQFFRQMVSLLEAEQPFALATVVHTSGSTPQKAGARAVILPDGRVIGTLGGGCMEAESRRRALELIRSESLNTETRRHGDGREQEGKATETLEGVSPLPERLNARTPEHLLLDLHLDDDFGWDDGLICGGSSQIFIQRLPHPTPSAQVPRPNPYAAAVALKGERRRGVLAMVVAASQTGDVGRTILISENGETVGALDDPALAVEVDAAARELLWDGGEAPRRVRLAEGAATLYLEPVLPRPVLLIMGAGHIGSALCHYGARIGFEVVVVDDRASFANRERLPDADEVIVDSVVDVARRWPKTPETYIILVTRGHRNDAVLLREVIHSPCGYIGMIGSRRKILTIYQEFLAEGIATPEQLARVHAPIGLDISALTVDEIAVSIAAELIAVRRKGSGVKGNTTCCPEPAPSSSQTTAGEALSPDPLIPTPGAQRHADRDRAGGGGVPPDGDAEAALAVRQRQRDRTGRPLAERLPDPRPDRGGGPSRG